MEAVKLAGCLCREQITGELSKVILYAISYPAWFSDVVQRISWHNIGES